MCSNIQNIYYQQYFQRTVTDHREDVIDLFPGIFMTVKMVPDSIGRWLLHCHVNDHMVHGMETLYDVIGMYQKASDLCRFLSRSCSYEPG